MAETVNVRALSPEPMQIKKVKDYRLKTAGFWTRFWAYLIDLIVISSLTSILVKPLFLLIGWEDLEILHLSLYGSVRKK